MTRGPSTRAATKALQTEGCAPAARQEVATFTVNATIAPKGSRTAGVRRDGSRYSRPASPHEHDFTEAVAREAMVCRAKGAAQGATGSAARGAAVPPYRVDLVFCFRRPGRPSWDWPTRLDLDKTVRAVLDGLVRGGLLEDDRHVVELVASKRWSAGLEHLVVEVSHAAEPGCTFEEPQTAMKGSAWTPPLA